MTRDVRELAGAWKKFQHHTYLVPSPDLAWCVEHYWLVSWDYGEPYRQSIAPSPNVHLTFRDGTALVNGIASERQVKVLQGSGGVFGVKFRPGCFRPFLRAPVSTITDRSIDAGEVFDRVPPGPVEVETVEQFLRTNRPEPDPKTEQVANIVARIAARPDIARVATVARDLDLSVRRLQRLFAEYVGIGPKWVIRRYRLQEVTERFAAGAEIDWAPLAADLGYADQAHFARDFKAMFGEPPTSYAQRY